jgi:hypothetical protein
MRGTEQEIIITIVAIYRKKQPSSFERKFFSFFNQSVHLQEAQANFGFDRFLFFFVFLYQFSRQLTC